MSEGSKGRGKGALRAVGFHRSMRTDSPLPGSVSVGGRDNGVSRHNKRIMVGRIKEVLDVATFWAQIGTGTVSSMYL